MILSLGKTKNSDIFEKSIFNGQFIVREVEITLGRNKRFFFTLQIVSSFLTLNLLRVRGAESRHKEEKIMIPLIRIHFDVIFMSYLKMKFKFSIHS